MLINCPAIYPGAKVEYDSFIKRATHLDAICKSRAARNYAPPGGVPGIIPRMLWLYRCLMRPYLLKVFALILWAASAAVIWSEATIGSGREPDLSPFSLVCAHRI